MCPQRGDANLRASRLEKEFKVLEESRSCLHIAVSQTKQILKHDDEIMFHVMTTVARRSKMT